MTGYCIWKSYKYEGHSPDLLKLFADQPYPFLLDSSFQGPRGRYSFIGFDPFAVVEYKGKDSLERLRRQYNQFLRTFKNMPTPFAAGIVGFLSYDLGLQLEDVYSLNPDTYNLPDVLFGFYDCLLTIDHFEKKLYVTSTGLPERNNLLAAKRAKERLYEIITRLGAYKESSTIFEEDDYIFHDEHVPLIASTTKEQYIDAIGKAKDYIRNGDIYQVNLSQKFSFDPGQYRLLIDPIRLYQNMRKISPSHFSCYFDARDVQIVSSSPERFLLKQGDIIQTSPMKGTRPRGVTIGEDNQFREDLLNSEKEKAELLMVTDLERNDLGRVCRYGSVNVKEIRTIEEYSTVFQTTSTIEGQLNRDRDCFDVLAACFPSGSVTGCPKIRAMKIIDELEIIKRSVYTGSLGYITFDGRMDFNVLIRTMIVRQGKIHYHVGGGIVADSLAQQEYEETLTKAKAMNQCLRQTFLLKEYALG